MVHRTCSFGRTRFHFALDFICAFGSTVSRAPPAQYELQVKYGPWPDEEDAVPRPRFAPLSDEAAWAALG